MTSRFRRVMVLAALAGLLASAPASAQPYPSRPITIVAGYTPGAVAASVSSSISFLPASGSMPSTA